MKYQFLLICYTFIFTPTIIYTTSHISSSPTTPKPKSHHFPFLISKMKINWSFLMILTVAITVSMVEVRGEDQSDQSKSKTIVKIVKGKKLCDKGWECKGFSAYCCNHTISDYFQTYQFENLFSKRNTPVAHAVGFWDYRSFITAAAQYQPLGFGTTGGKMQGMKEVAAFLGHVGSKTSCKSKKIYIHTHMHTNTRIRTCSVANFIWVVIELE